MFTELEVLYLDSQRLGRVATVDRDGQPDVSPVGYEFDGTYIYIGGHDLTTTHKYQNIEAGHDKVAFVVDDLVSVDPWHLRGIRIYGERM